MAEHQLTVLFMWDVFKNIDVFWKFMRRANSSFCGGYIQVAVAKDHFAATVKVMNKKSADARVGLQM